MQLLVIGSGGREHALAWKLACSPLVHKVFVAPGNAGTYREPKVENVALDPMDFPALVLFAKNQGIRFTIVGPEAPLVAGIVDYFQAHDLLCFGPTQKAAQLEGSKAFAKAFMHRHGIPTAPAQIFCDSKEALDALAEASFPLVIKADGLAAGKGVVITHTLAQAKQAIHTLGTQTIILEAFLEGQELSFIVISDGQHFQPLATSQDHKKRDAGDQGPNTGGMGAYSPVPFATPALQTQIVSEVIAPTLRGMQAEGIPFLGFLYAGLMITPNQQIYVLEYNCRLGDPETQPLLMRLRSDFATLCLSTLQGTLQNETIDWDPRYALGVVLASKGYPNAYTQGDVLTHLHDMPSPSQYVKLFHAGTQMQDGNIVTTGGRVLCATALRGTLGEAQTAAYTLAQKAAWPNAFYRTDIGWRAL